MKKIIVLLLIAIICMQYSAYADEDSIKAKILSVEKIDDSYQYKAKILDGDYKGKVYGGKYTPMKYTQYDFKLRKGCIVYVDIYDSGGSQAIEIRNIYRNYHIRILTIIFILALLIFGRGKGFVSLVSLIITGMCIFFIYIPMVLKGYDIIFVTVFNCILIAAISFIIISGFTQKTYAAIIGTVGGILCAFILIKIFSEIMCITGTISEDVYLLVYEKGVELDFSKLFISGVMIGTIGVLMDVSMSISSVVMELKSNSPNMEIKSLVKSGLTVGKDVMATMVNTLILAYAGTAMPLFFWMVSSDLNFASTLNLEEVASEILRALCGSVGLILAVPITSLVASYLACRHRTPSKIYSRH